ncbi:MAG: hypothetical protein BWK76_18475 [Desulfobulbaceae bacterium A2]|nr:MAG: hypothetical protein BWK76_18475 [Desulfobulbaceae bacterium A2]
MHLSIRQARQSLAQIEQLLSREGELRITRRGKEIARLLPLNGAVAIPSHRALREKTPSLDSGSELLVRMDRDAR